MSSTTWWLSTQTTENWAFVDAAFSKQECETVIAGITQRDPALISGGVLDSDYRHSEISWLDSSDPKWQWLFRKLTDICLQINQQFWRFDIRYLESLQYTEYHSPGGHYDLHLDMINSGIHNRKLSFTVQLTDPAEYLGGDLEFHTGKTAQTANRSQGTVIVFPSYILHRVTPVMQGQRQSLVGWVCGDPFR